MGVGRGVAGRVNESTRRSLLFFSQDMMSLLGSDFSPQRVAARREAEVAPLSCPGLCF